MLALCSIVEQRLLNDVSVRIRQRQYGGLAQWVSVKQRCGATGGCLQALVLECCGDIYKQRLEAYFRTACQKKWCDLGETFMGGALFYSCGQICCKSYAVYEMKPHDARSLA